MKAVDPGRELALCAGEDVEVVQLFAGGTARSRVELDDLSRAALKWFVVSSRSHFHRGTLVLTYMAEPSDAGEERWLTRRVKVPLPR